jgi:hypothetical protein
VQEAAVKRGLSPAKVPQTKPHLAHAKTPVIGLPAAGVTKHSAAANVTTRPPSSSVSLIFAFANEPNDVRQQIFDTREMRRQYLVRWRFRVAIPNAARPCLQNENGV